MALRRALLLALLLCPVLLPQAQIASGDVRGTVVDPSGGAISKAKVTITEPDRGITRESTTDEKGEYLLPALPPGRYRLRVEASGFSSKILEGVTVSVGETLTLLVQLDVGTIQQQVEVQADLPVVETQKTQQATTIGPQGIRNLPINRRNYLEFALLSPATADTSEMVDGTDYRVAQTPQSGITFGGGNGRGNMFYVDGVENFINSGGVRLSLSQEAVQEFQINRNSSVAEFGWATGGTVNIVSRSGSNRFGGNLFGFIRNRAFQARNYFDPSKSAYTRVQAGGTFGGPIKKDKTFFFAAYEILNRNETSFVPIVQDPGMFVRLTPSQSSLVTFLAGSGIPQLQGLAAVMRVALTPASNPYTVKLFNENSGTFPFGETTQYSSARLDHRFSDSHSLYVRLNWGDFYNPVAQFGALIAYNRGRTFDQWDGTAMLGDSLILGTNWVVETRAMFNYNSLFVTPTDPNGPEMNISGYGFFGRDIFLPFKNWERHYQVAQNWNFHSSKHDLKFGFDINPVRDTVMSETFFSGRFNFGEAVPLGLLLNNSTGNPNAAAELGQTLVALGRPDLVPTLTQPITSLQAFSLGLPAFYQQGFGDPNWIGWSKRFGFFAQDSWRVSSGFTLNLGLRYDLEINEAVVGSDYNNFAPRIGFAWSPDADRKTVIRGGYGLYYTQTYLQIPNVADTLSGKNINQVFVPLTGIPGLNNPQTGRPTTSADIWQGLFKAGVIPNQPITQKDLLPFGIRVGPNMPFSAVFGSEPLRQGYSQQGSFEMERAFGNMAFSAGYIFNKALGIARTSGQNVYYTGGKNPNGTPAYGFYNPTLLQKNIFTYDGNSSYNAGYLQAQQRLSRGIAFNAHYTFSKAMDDVTDFNSDFSPFDQLNKRGEWALSPFHHSHRVVVSAVLQSQLRPGKGKGFNDNFFGGWTLSPIFTYNSWRPFNTLTGVDVNGDRYTTNDRPPGAGRNIGIGPDYKAFDLRLSRQFGLGDEGRRNLEFIAEGFNMLNHTNFRNVNNTVGNVALRDLPNPIRGVAGGPTYVPLAYTSAYDPRQFQFALKFNF